jgi:transposase-like protein
VPWQASATGLEERLADLHRRVHRGTYRAHPSRRIYIPKPDGRQRPLGIAALDDKLVQQAVVTILTQIYEKDFRGFSYGYRPGRSPHHALDALSVALTRKRVNHVLDCDIRGFFDTLSHEWLVKFLRLLLDSRGLDLKAWYHDDPFFKSMIGVHLMQVNIKHLIAEAQCDDSVRELRWPEGRQGRPCPFCDAKRVITRGFDENEPARQRDACHVCGKRFDDLTGTIFAGHHQPLKVWMWCLYCRGLHWSNAHMAKERDLEHRAVHQMTTDLRAGLVKKRLTSRDLER